MVGAISVADRGDHGVAQAGGELHRLDLAGRTRPGAMRASTKTLPVRRETRGDVGRRQAVGRHGGTRGGAEHDGRRVVDRAERPRRPGQPQGSSCTSAAGVAATRDLWRRCERRRPPRLDGAVGRAGDGVRSHVRRSVAAVRRDATGARRRDGETARWIGVVSFRVGGERSRSGRRWPGVSALNCATTGRAAISLRLHRSANLHYCAGHDLHIAGGRERRKLETRCRTAPRRSRSSATRGSRR